MTVVAGYKTWDKQARTIIVSKATRVTAQALYNHRRKGQEILNRCLLSRDRKTATEAAEVTRSGSSVATGKARSPTVRSRERLTINEDKLERSRWRASTSATWQSSLWSLQPVQLTKERSDVLELWPRKDKPIGGVHHCLQPWQEIWWNAGECRIAVVQSREDGRRHQWLKNKSRHWPTDSTQLTQYRVAGRYRFRDVRPHRDITVDVYSVSNGGSWWNTVGADVD